MKLLLIDGGSPLTQAFEEQANELHTSRNISESEAMRWAQTPDDEKERHPLEGYDAVIYLPGHANHEALQHAKKLFKALYEHKAHRFLTVSRLGAHDPEAAEDAKKDDLRFHHELDKEVKFSGLTYTILRAGDLVKEEGSGKITASKELENRKPGTPIADVVQTLLECLRHQHTENKVIEIAPGDTPIDKALVNLPLT